MKSVPVSSMLKSNIDLYKDFAQPPKEPKKPTAKELKAQLKLKPASELVANFGDEVKSFGSVDDLMNDLNTPPIKPAIKNSPFDELFYPLFDRVQASNDLSLLQAIAKVVDDYGF
jgi:hypothetical protein